MHKMHKIVENNIHCILWVYDHIQYTKMFNTDVIVK